MKLHIAIEEFLLACIAERKSPKTLRAYKDHLSNFSQFAGDPEIEEIEPATIRSFIAHEMTREGAHGRQLSSSSIHKSYSVIRTFFRWAYREGIIERCPVDNVKAPKLDARLPEPLSRDELERLMRYLRTQTSFRNLVIFEFFLDTGARLNEVVRLNLEDVNLKEGFALLHGKGRKEGMVPLGRRLRRDLYAYIHRHRQESRGELALFTTRQGTRLSREGMATMIKRIMRAVRVKGRYGPHKLRHTFATEFLRKGYNRKLWIGMIKKGGVSFGRLNPRPA